MQCEIWQQHEGTAGWSCYQQPETIVCAYTITDVLPALANVERRVEEQRLTAVGFISYEASPAFDEALATFPNTDNRPLVWFALFKSSQTHSQLPDRFSKDHTQRNKPNFIPSLTNTAYRSKIAQVRRHLERGDSYQVNLSFRLREATSIDPYALFYQLVESQRSKQSLFIHCKEFTICSASPELFFKLDGEKIATRPMKGSYKRGRTQSEDQRFKKLLATSEKNQAENVMIVDMIRNDLSRIAKNGTVKPHALFSVEKYPTIWQMTSTVTAETERSITDIFKALFPCASITGAPKARTMEIIKDLEDSPRGVYTGAIGSIAPGRKAEFNVAIRTAFVNNASCEYSVGSGVVWDSNPGDEYEECLLKSNILTRPVPDFQLIETIRWDLDGGYFLLPYHLQRLLESCKYFDIDISKERIQQELDAYQEFLSRSTQKVRLLLDQSGRIHLEHTPLKELYSPITLRLGSTPIDSRNPLLYHKTTSREFYSKARSPKMREEELPLFWNERGEITESSFANVVFDLGDSLVTPPLNCGLLPGTFRAFLLDRQLIREQVIHKNSITSKTPAFLINSVREWIPASVKEIASNTASSDAIVEPPSETPHV